MIKLRSNFKMNCKSPQSPSDPDRLVRGVQLAPSLKLASSKRMRASQLPTTVTLVSASNRLMDLTVVVAPENVGPLSVDPAEEDVISALVHALNVKAITESRKNCERVKWRKELTDNARMSSYRFLP